MIQPINPNTNIPMSLKVEKMQQIKQVQTGQQQGQLAQQLETEDRLKQQRVNENNEVDQTRIRQRQGSQDQEQEQKQEKDGEEPEKKKKDLKKGNIIDIKV